MNYWLIATEIAVVIGIVWFCIGWVITYLEEPKAKPTELTQEEVNNYKGVCARCNKMITTVYKEDGQLRRYHMFCEEMPPSELVTNVLCALCGHRVGDNVREPIVRVEGFPLHKKCIEGFKNVVPTKEKKLEDDMASDSTKYES